jgi:hypothetical protein
MRPIAKLACLCLALSSSARADSLDCAGLVASFRTLPHYEADVPPAAPQDGACVLDGLQLASQTPGWPDLRADRLRVSWDADTGSLDLGGFRAAPRLGDRDMDDRLRQVLRLQSADLTARLVDGPEGALDLTAFDLALSGGTRLSLTASLRGVAATLTAPPAGVLTDLTLDWRSDGRLMRPIMDLAGERIAGEGGDAAVEAARDALAALVAALPEAALTPGTRGSLAAMVADLPQGRGQLTLRLTAPDGIGVAGLALAALSDDPLGPEALARFFAGATLTADWQPGLQP